MFEATVTVLIPARNEANDIVACLQAVAAQDYPLDRIEVIVVDGASDDATAEVAGLELDRHAFGAARVVPNPTATTPSNLNVGLEHATGEILCRVDARSRIPTNYVRQCVELLQSLSEVAVVGGAQVAISRSDSIRDRGIARALNNRWGMGLSRYRRDAPSGPADTVYLGAFRTRDLREVGGWNEAFVTNQDFELNRRMSDRGVVWFTREIPVEYIPRPTIGALFSQYHRFGRWKVRYWRTTGDRPRPRQLVAIAAPPIALLVGAVLVGRKHRWVALAGASAVVAVELLGAPKDGDRNANVFEHAVAVVALGAVTSGWHTGVVREWMTARRGSR